jgi:hypothetical protein
LRLAWNGKSEMLHSRLVYFRPLILHPTRDKLWASNCTHLLTYSLVLMASNNLRPIYDRSPVLSIFACFLHIFTFSPHKLLSASSNHLKLGLPTSTFCPSFINFLSHLCLIHSNRMSPTTPSFLY